MINWEWTTEFQLSDHVYVIMISDLHHTPVSRNEDILSGIPPHHTVSVIQDGNLIYQHYFRSWEVDVIKENPIAWWTLQKL